MRLGAYIALLLSSLGIFGCGLNPCAEGEEERGGEHLIIGRANIRTGPGTDYAQVVNQKATSILKKTNYKSVDSSETVREICRKNGWSQIEVIEPSYLSSDTGWIETNHLREQAFSDDGKRIFEEADFSFDTADDPYKEIIVKGVNRVHREHAGCDKLDTGTAHVDWDTKSSLNPVFFVTCVSDRVFNVFFSKADVESDKPL